METKGIVDPPKYITFGAFVMDVTNRTLLFEGEKVNVSSRAFDMLIILFLHLEETVDKRTLLEGAWPDSVVEECNIRVHISNLKKALSEKNINWGHIDNIPGRGYRLVCSEKVELNYQAPCVFSDGKSNHHKLKRLIGREFAVNDLIAILPENQIVTIYGPGGVGKTTLALSVAESVTNNYQDGVYLVDLSTINDTSLVHSHIASVLNIPTSEGNATHGIASQLSDKSILILLDNAEQFVEQLCELVEVVSEVALSVHFLVTSREPLRAIGESLFPLAPLEYPDPQVVNGLSSIANYSAIELFINQVSLAIPNFVFDDSNASDISHICARLDGLPLAIELAAARVNLFDLKDLASNLDDRFTLLTKGRRTALHRHQTLRAMIDWSYESLNEVEAQAWCHLSVFVGPFSLESALFILDNLLSHSISAIEVLDALVEKSLICVTKFKGTRKFRLLESMRYYALDKLRKSGDTEAHLLHANYCLSQIRCPPSEWGQFPEKEALLFQDTLISEIRSSLDWLIDVEEENSLVVELCVESAPLWFRLLLLPELRDYLNHARDIFEQSQEMQEKFPALGAKLYLSLGHAIFHTQGPGPRVRESLVRGLKFAQVLPDKTIELQTIWALYAHAVTCGDYQEVSAWTEKYARSAVGCNDASVIATLLRAKAIDLHFQGKHGDALKCAESALYHPGVSSIPSATHIFFYDHRIATSAHFARALWVNGFPDKALAICEEYFELAEKLNQPFAFGYFLVCGACPVSLWTGEIEVAQKYTDVLANLVSGVASNVWQVGGEVFSQAIDLKINDRVPELKQVIPMTHFYTDTLCTIDFRLVPNIVSQRALKASWCTPEILRVQGEALLLKSGGKCIEQANSLFLKAYESAKDSKALSWQLRAAISLAKHGRQNDLGPLESTYNEFTEGHLTHDMKCAKQILESFSSADFAKKSNR